MDIWIRSQDKMKLIKIGFIECGEYEGTHFINGFPVNSIDNYDLGIYKSKKRALEVLDEIQKFLQPDFKCDGFESEYEGFHKTFHLHFSEPNIFHKRVYEMPEE